MSKYHVFQEKSGMLRSERIEGEWVGSFEADCHCDMIMEIININEKLEHPDPFWAKRAEEIDRNGI